MNKQLVSNDLLPVYRTTDTDEQVVDARELHGFLNVGRDFTSWIRARIEQYQFAHDVDFTVTLTKTGERQNITRHDYSLKLDMAKELAMVENNELGRKARRYFIEVEKRLRQPQVPLAPLANEYDQITKLLQMLRMAEREGLFVPETERALRVQIAELVLKEPLGKANTLPDAPKPEIASGEPYTGRWYTTSEIAVIAGATKALIAQLATQYNLRTDAHSRERHTGAQRSTGLVVIEYNELGKDRLVQLAADRIKAGYTPKASRKRRKK